MNARRFIEATAPGVVVDIVSLLFVSAQRRE
jgi:hypothetical protein